MEKFEKIFTRAAKRHGGAKAVEASLSKPKSTAALRKIPDDRWLAGMTHWAAASIAFAPEIGVPAANAMKRWPKLYGQYGFLDSFNPTLTQRDGPLQHGKIIDGVGWVADDFDEQITGAKVGDVLTFTTTPKGTEEPADMTVTVKAIQALDSAHPYVNDVR